VGLTTVQRIGAACDVCLFFLLPLWPIKMNNYYKHTNGDDNTDSAESHGGRHEPMLTSRRCSRLRAMTSHSSSSLAAAAATRTRELSDAQTTTGCSKQPVDLIYAEAGFCML